MVRACSIVKVRSLISHERSFLSTEVLVRTMKRHFPDLPNPTSIEPDLLEWISEITTRPLIEIFGRLLQDKQAEREVGFPLVAVDPNVLSLSCHLNLPEGFSEYFIPISIGRDSITFACHTPLIQLSDGALALIRDSFPTRRVDVVYSLPELFAAAKTMLEKEDRVTGAGSSEIERAGERTCLSPFPYLDLEGFQGDAGLNAVVPVGLQRRYRMVPIYSFGSQYLTVATIERLDVIKRSEIRSHFADLLEVRYVAADPDRISAVIAANELAAMDSTRLVGQLRETGSDSTEGTELVYVDAATIGERANKDDASIIPLVDAFLAYSAKQHASDLHIAPFDTHLAVEYRVDDLKHSYPEPIPAKFAAPVISRLKYLSNIDIQRLVDPQYGRFTIRLKNVGDIEVRTTIMPTVYGDSATLRFAPKGGKIKTLEENGMQPHEVQIVRRVVEGSSGLLLVVGPTGSGKSTTLYSILAGIPTEQWEVLSAEEPPERYLPGIKQTDITRGISYAKFLAGALRADPDYINIGETRTPDTAAQLIRAVETGHICFSTLHTAEACSAPGRVMGLEVPPYSLADSLSAVIAQTLVAKACPKCSFAVPFPAESEMRILGIKLEWFGASPRLLEGRGCPNCMNRGFRGRTLIAEGYTVDSTIRRLILNREAADAIRKAQEEQGGRTMLQQACEAAGAGLVPLSKALALGRAGKD